MKREELEALGLTKEQVDKVLDAHHAELDPVQGDLEMARDDLNAANGTVESQKTTISNLKKDLEEFKDADVSGMKQKIADLEADLQAKETEHQAQIADRDFQDNVKNMIAKYKGKNEKAIKALLDVDTLKVSKNQNEDLDKAMKALTEAEDSKMLFGESEGQVIGGGNPIGTVTKGGNQDGDAALRAAMGLPPISEQK